MGGIEKTNLLTLAIERCIMHRNSHLSSELTTPAVISALNSLADAVEEIPNYMDIFDFAEKYWIDLSRERAKE